MPYTAVNDVNIYYEEFGRGETVLFLHSHFSRGLLAFPHPAGAEDFLPENLLKNGNTDFIEDIKIRHFEAHRGDWQTYLRNTVTDWQQQPSLTDDEWKNISCPAFFINGENDPFGTCEELQDKVPSAKIYKVIGGSHHPHFVGEQIDDINKRILDFLSGL